MIVPKYYEDLKVLHKNTMPDRAYYIPASGRVEELIKERELSDRFIALSGEWKFCYFDSIYDVKEEFYREGFDTGNFDTVNVPGVWQNYGYDRHQYTNTRYPFPMDPPYVPYANPCGEYVRKFNYHKDEKAPKAFLNFEGVDSCFYVWVNGIFSGYSQVSHSTSEFDITDKLKDGENTLSVLVLKWCDGSYLEDQDKFRMSGIFRDVYILRRPEEGIFDYFVKARPEESGKKGRVEITLKYQNKFVPTRAALFDREGRQAAAGQAAKEQTETEGQAVLCMEVENAHLWSAEMPYLYTLVLETKDEVISDYVGIREIYIKDGVLYINGTKVKFHGVNRHDSDPVTGFAIDFKQIMRDLRLMKEHNVNAIRTSHYPNAPWCYRLYDMAGFYVIDEADNESHGIANAHLPDMSWESRAQHWNEAIADNPEFTESTLDRTKRCVERDKNRPSVVIWSMGNESAYGCTFEEALKWTKEFDDTRLTHYESSQYFSSRRKYDFDNIDICSRMYPSLDDIHRYFKEDGKKPYVMCEFCHAMGNGPGDFEDYFEVISQYDGACGGFVWEWCDHAIDLGRTIQGKKLYAYGGDHGEYPHDGNFCMDGLVYPDRRVHTGLLEFKNVYRPARVAGFNQQTKEIALHNYMDFLNLKDFCEVRYEVFCDGIICGEGMVEEAFLDIPAHGEGRVPILFEIPDKGKCFLKVSYYQKQAQGLLPKGFLLGFEEVFVKTGNNENSKVRELFSDVKREAAFDIREDDCKFIISTPEFSYSYDKFTGLFSDMTYRNITLLKQPMEFNIWRAPTDNDRNIRKEWESAQYDRTATRAYGTKLSAAKDSVILETELSIAAVYLQRILDVKACWTVYSDGALDIALFVKKNLDFPSLPRFGLRLFLPKTMSKVTYCGIGPWESYIDKRRAGYHGVFDTDVRLMHEDYVKPQENGSHHDCDYVTVYGDRAELTAAGMKTFAFNASVYTQEELTKKPHNYQLEESPYTVFCVDYRQGGIGSNSCGPSLLKKYRLNEESFEFKVRLIPGERHK